MHCEVGSEFSTGQVGARFMEFLRVGPLPVHDL
jgi:hypothetical protein